MVALTGPRETSISGPEMQSSKLEIRKFIKVMLFVWKCSGEIRG